MEDEIFVSEPNALMSLPCRDSQDEFSHSESIFEAESQPLCI